MLNIDPISELDSEIGELLEEFEAVMEEMSAPSVRAHGACEPVLGEAEQRADFSDAVTDSGIEDTDDSESTIIFCFLTSQSVEGSVTITLSHFLLGDHADKARV